MIERRDASVFFVMDVAAIKKVVVVAKYSKRINSSKFLTILAACVSTNVLLLKETVRIG